MVVSADKLLKNVKLATDFYNEALQLYLLMAMRWGIVRSTIGLNLLGERRDLPTGLVIEGCDRTIWSNCKGKGIFEVGVLCENIP